MCSSCPSHYSDVNLTQFDCYTPSEILGTQSLPAVHGDSLIRPKDGSTQINMWCMVNCSFAHSLWFSSFFCLMSPPSPWMKFTFFGQHTCLPRNTFFFYLHGYQLKLELWHPDGSPGRTWNKIRNFIEFMRKFFKTKKLHFYKWVSIFQDMDHLLKWTSW